MLCFTIISYHLVTITHQYLQFNVKVNRDVQLENQITFPAVTVCNMCPISLAALMDEEQVLGIMMTELQNDESGRVVEDFQRQQQEAVANQRLKRSTGKLTHATSS